MSVTPSQSDLKLSIVIPAFNERESLERLLPEIDDALRAASDGPLAVGLTEVIVVDDGSSDGTFGYLEDQIEAGNFDFHLRAFRLRRNRGKSAALKVGLRSSRGATVALMDADLQDNPSDLASMVEASRRTGGLIVGWKKIRKDPISKRFPSKVFNRIVSRVSGVNLHDHNCGFKAGPGVLFRGIPMYGELHRFIPCLAWYAGFPVEEMVVEHRAREFGTSKFGLERFARGIADLLTVSFINRYSKRPNHAFAGVSIIAFLLGFSIFSYLFFVKIAWGQPIDGRPLFDVGMLLLLASLILLCFGFVLEALLRHTGGDSWVESLDVVDER